MENLIIMIIEKLALFISLTAFVISGVFALEGTTFNVIHNNKSIISSFNNPKPHKLITIIIKDDHMTEIGLDDQLEVGD